MTILDREVPKQTEVETIRCRISDLSLNFTIENSNGLTLGATIEGITNSTLGVLCQQICEDAIGNSVVYIYEECVANALWKIWGYQRPVGIQGITTTLNCDPQVKLLQTEIRKKFSELWGKFSTNDPQIGKSAGSDQWDINAIKEVIDRYFVKLGLKGKQYDINRFDNKRQLFIELSLDQTGFLPGNILLSLEKELLKSGFLGVAICLQPAIDSNRKRKARRSDNEPLSRT
jgi:hypothetical protein